MAKPKPKKPAVKPLHVLLLVLVLAAGFGLAAVRPNNLHPRNLVWASDKSVEVPADLTRFLRAQPECFNFVQGVTPHGVGLWSVYQVSQGRSAKVAYGCGVGLTRYAMAVKTDRKWQLIQPADYFADNKGNLSADSFLPQCAVIKKYQIDKSIEPFCIDSKGKPKQNTI